MILAHHAGEDLLAMAIVSGAGAGTVLLALARVRLDELKRRLRGRHWS